MNDLGARAVWTATDRFSVTASGHGRIYTLQTQEDQPNASPNIQPNNPGYFPPSHSYDGGGDLAARYKWERGVVRPPRQRELRRRRGPRRR